MKFFEPKLEQCDILSLFWGSRLIKIRCKVDLYVLECHFFSSVAHFWSKTDTTIHFIWSLVKDKQNLREFAGFYFQIECFFSLNILNTEYKFSFLKIIMNLVIVYNWNYYISRFIFHNNCIFLGNHA